MLAGTVEFSAAMVFFFARCFWCWCYGFLMTSNDPLLRFLVFSFPTHPILFPFQHNQHNELIQQSESEYSNHNLYHNPNPLLFPSFLPLYLSTNPPGNLSSSQSRGVENPKPARPFVVCNLLALFLSSLLFTFTFSRRSPTTPLRSSSYACPSQLPFSYPPSRLSPSVAVVFLLRVHTFSFSFVSTRFFRFRSRKLSPPLSHTSLRPRNCLFYYSNSNPDSDSTLNPHNFLTFPVPLH